MLKRVKEEKKQFAQSNALVADQKRAEVEKINLRLQKLLDSFLDGVIEREDYTAEKTKLMSRKKSLQEQSCALLENRNAWLEPFQSWILTAKDAGEIAVSGSLQEKRVLAQKVFGSNLVLDCKKARGSCVKPWSALVETSQTGGMVPTTGLEPILRVFPALPIAASCVSFMPLLIRCKPCVRKPYCAFTGNAAQQNLCGLVRLCGSCAEQESCAESVRADTGSDSAQSALAGLRFALSRRVCGLDWGKVADWLPAAL